MQILFIISEVEDIIKTGGLADVGKALPLALAELGHEVRIVMPYYRQVADTFDLSDASIQQVLHVNNRSYNYRVKQLSLDNVPVYLIDHEYFSQSSTPYTDTLMANNAQKFSLFSLCAVCASHELGFKPDIVHVNDWHTSMVPYFLKSDYFQRNDLLSDPQWYTDAKVVISVHNAAFQGIEGLDQVGVLDHIDASKVYNHNGYLNMLKTGILYADITCPVSPSYARELFTELGSHGVNDVISRAGDSVIGVLNGCDYSQWDPSTDPMIPSNFSADDIKGKAKCKAALQAENNLPRSSKIPVFGMVCRATRQKGFDYLLPILEDMLSHNVQLIIMGTGDSRITSELTRIAATHPEKMAFVEDFLPEMAHMIEAGSDFFLMPSEFEPCGLNQMYSLAYGTLPIVRKVGGLADTIIDIKEPNGNGFVFDEPTGTALVNCIRRAIILFLEDKTAFDDIKQRAMSIRFTWHAAAEEYIRVYKR
ncbi:glycogen synthase [Agaribacter marinus]|uniref:Glycogen synthase n=1 Tax=Agaribacter marinus TaxID=1431249 RepID=A0AA37T006_9ALTE|nr:glycogen synthase [Agaribacter marinus]GLR71729.1 glycogen synthase [Agaribacter marinus]